MYIIVGLGNPGKKYNSTWHNLGFMAIDRLAEKYDFSFKAGKGEFYSASGFINYEKVLLVKPITFMNLSGKAIKQVIDFYKLEDLKGLVIVYDDININLGNIRLRERGSAGGHNGLKSIISNLGTNEFQRLRLGFKTPVIEDWLNRNRALLPDIVLSKIPSKLEKEIPALLDLSIESLEYLIEEKSFTRAMNKYNKIGEV